ncbi:MAG: C1 family peptidase [Ruminococcus sp.]
MKKIFTLLVSVTLVLCSINTAFGLKNNTIDSKITGGVILQQGVPQESILPETIESDSGLPQSYSSVEKGYVTAVKDQSSQNVCVLFSSTSAMETALIMNGYGEYDLSEEYGNYWASLRNDGTGWTRDRVNIGAYPMTGYNYLTSGGVVEDSLLPYMSRTEEYFEDLGNIDPLFYAGSIKTLLGEDITAENMKKSIMSYGGVVSSFALLSKYLEKNKNAYFCGDELGEEDLSSSGHSVYVVGWDDNYSKENFLEGSQPDNNGAWLIKNSWGNILDYIWVSYEDKYFASDVFGGNFSVTSVIKNHSCNQLVNIDTYGAVYDMTFENAVTDPYDVTFINTLDFSKEMPSISNVQFSTSNTGAKYEIYYIPTDNGVPIDSQSLG